MILKSFKDFKHIKESNSSNIKQDIFDIKEELKNINHERKSLEDDMESEAGEKGDSWTDEDANRYGEEFNDIDVKEIKLRKDLEKLINQLDEEEEKELYIEYANSFEDILKDMNYNYELNFIYKKNKVNIEVIINKDEFDFCIYDTGALYLIELGKEISLGEIYNDSKNIKKFITNILELEGKEYTDYIETFEM